MSTYESGDYIKVEFKSEATGDSEWLRVRVDYCDEEAHLVFGWLDDEPVIDHGVRPGAHLAVSYDRVREHKKSS